MGPTIPLLDLTDKTQPRDSDGTGGGSLDGESECPHGGRSLEVPSYTKGGSVGTSGRAKSSEPTEVGAPRVVAGLYGPRSSRGGCRDKDTGGRSPHPRLPSGAKTYFDLFSRSLRKENPRGSSSISTLPPLPYPINHGLESTPLVQGGRDLRSSPPVLVPSGGDPGSSATVSASGATRPLLGVPTFCLYGHLLEGSPRRSSVVFGPPDPVLSQERARSPGPWGLVPRRTEHRRREVRDGGRGVLAEGQRERRRVLWSDDQNPGGVEFS